MWSMNSHVPCRRARYDYIFFRASMCVVVQTRSNEQRELVYEDDDATETTFVRKRSMAIVSVRYLRKYGGAEA